MVAFFKYRSTRSKNMAEAYYLVMLKMNVMFYKQFKLIS